MVSGLTRSCRVLVWASTASIADDDDLLRMRKTALHAIRWTVGSSAVVEGSAARSTALQVSFKQRGDHDLMLLTVDPALAMVDLNPHLDTLVRVS